MSGYPRSAPTYSKGNAPSNYVAGLGRGAMGFTTRSDVGPSLASSAGSSGGGNTSSQGRPQYVDARFGEAPAGYVAGRGRGMGALAKELTGDEAGVGGGLQSKDKSAPGEDFNESNYDAFNGYNDSGLFASVDYDADDAEADRVYDAVDKAMDARHKRKRDSDNGNDTNRAQKPKISQQFADLKKNLKTISMSEWDSIPEVGDHGLKYTQKKRFDDVYVPLPDSIIKSNADQLQASNGENVLRSIDANNDGTMTAAGLSNSRATLTNKLDRMSDSVLGQTVVDPRGYMTNLENISVNSASEIGDIKRARLLLSSVTSTNPKHAPGWIAAARVEEVAGKLSAARKIIQTGCDKCPSSEDVWLENTRLTPNKDEAKSVLAEAVRHLPTSVRLWVEAAELETLQEKKKVVLRRALELIPNSEALWKAAIELESANDARIMLARAVECVPKCLDMWLTLAKLESYENARKVLNQAREAMPTERSIWITAARLEEANGNQEIVGKIINKMLKSLNKFQVVIDRQYWLQEAQYCEKSRSLSTCTAIIKQTIHIGVDEEDYLVTWIDDANACIACNANNITYIETARAIFNHAIEKYSDDEGLWMAFVALEKDHGNTSSMQSVLQRAIKMCPHVEVLWLMAAKQQWLTGDIETARNTLNEAFEIHGKSEQIWLAAFKLEWKNNFINNAREVLKNARREAPSARIWMKASLLERECNDHDTALKYVDQGLQVFSNYDKLYMMGAEYSIEKGQMDAAREYYKSGLQKCSQSVSLWILYAQFEEQAHGVNKARSVLETARLKIPKCDELWLASIQLERRHGNVKLAETMMATAKQDCPVSGLLWAEDINTCPKPQQKSKSSDALAKCSNDPLLIVTVARLFYRERKSDKARKWFQRAVALDKQFGDAWAYYYAFEAQEAANNVPRAPNSTLGMEVAEDHSGNIILESIAKQCEDAMPNRGKLWCRVSKAVENRRLSYTELLLKVVELILTDQTGK